MMTATPTDGHHEDVPNKEKSRVSAPPEGAGSEAAELLDPVVLTSKLNWNRAQLREHRRKYARAEKEIAALKARVQSLGDAASAPGDKAEIAQLRSSLEAARQQAQAEQARRQALEKELASRQGNVAKPDRAAGEKDAAPDGKTASQLKWNRAQLKLERQRAAGLATEISELREKLLNAQKSAPAPIVDAPETGSTAEQREATKEMRLTLRRLTKQVNVLLDAMLPTRAPVADPAVDLDPQLLRTAKGRFAYIQKDLAAKGAEIRQLRNLIRQSNVRLLPLLHRINPQLSLPVDHKDVIPSEVILKEVIDAVDIVVAESVIASELRKGVDPEIAIMTGVRALLASKRIVQARSIAYGMIESGDARTSALGRICLSLCFHIQELPAPAIEILEGVDDALIQRYMPAEYVIALYHVDQARGRSRAAALLNDAGFDGISAAGRLRVAQTAFGFGDRDVAERLIATITQDDGDALVELDRNALAWLRAYGDRMHERAAAAPALIAAREAEPVTANFSVLEYKQGDYVKSSTNVGDYVQTIACLGNLARHSNVEFVGDEGLPGFMDTLRPRVKAERRLDTAKAKVRLVPVDRDASSDATIPRDTWHIAFGWYMHATYGAKFDFPLNENLRPLFVSFHVNNRDMLSDDAIAYLRKYAPIGCRDWTTTYLLLSLGIPAFFSGCITTTIDNVFGNYTAPADIADKPTCYVDSRPLSPAERGEPYEQLLQAFDWVRWEGFDYNLRYALDRLDSYCTDYRRVITSRLHCYLPCRSIGLDVDFRPRQPADIRFDGLYGIEGEALRAIADPIMAKLADVIGMILSGASVENVYARWAELCAPDVERSRAYAQTSEPLPPPAFDVAAACEIVRAAEIAPPERRFGDEAIDLAFASDGNLKHQLPVVLLSAIRNSSRPVRAWILNRDFTAEECAEIRQGCPEAELRFLPCDTVDYGPVLGMLKHITIATMDRLLLPLLLPEVSRITYVDIDTVVLGDLAELDEMPLNGAAVGARSSILPSAIPGYFNVYRPAMRLPKEVSWELRRRMHSRFALSFEGYNAGLLVLDLDAMRRDDFCNGFIPYVERYGMNDQEVLNCYTGPNRAPLPHGWNQFPSQQILQDPKLIHWIGPVKPWHEDHVLQQGSWARYREEWRGLFAGESLVEGEALVVAPSASD